MMGEDTVKRSMSELPEYQLRLFAGQDDFPGMVSVANAGHVADHIELVFSVEGLAADYAHLTNCDLSTDLVIVQAKADGKMVGFGRVWWWVNDAGERIYALNGEVQPEHRGRGIGRAILAWEEARLHDIAASHPTTEPRFFQTFVMEGAHRRMALLQHAGFAPVRYGYTMVRSLLNDVPDTWPLPEGLETRPVVPEHRRAIWDALDEAFRDHWGHRPSTEEDYQSFLTWPDAQPHLWQVAWDTRTNEIAGMVLNDIVVRDNEKLGQKRGWTDPICVRRPWRRQGLARALIMRSLKVLRDQGMTEAALGVDAQNPNKALHLYESCGYQQYQRSFTMRKDFGQST